MTTEKEEKTGSSDDQIVLINFKTTAANRKQFRIFALQQDMTLTQLILVALKEYIEKHSKG